MDCGFSDEGRKRRSVERRRLKRVSDLRDGSLYRREIWALCHSAKYAERGKADRNSIANLY